jgi:hypothetical protein
VPADLVLELALREHGIQFLVVNECDSVMGRSLAVIQNAAASSGVFLRNTMAPSRMRVTGNRTTRGAEVHQAGSCVHRYFDTLHGELLRNAIPFKRFDALQAHLPAAAPKRGREPPC